MASRCRPCSDRLIPHSAVYRQKRPRAWVGRAILDETELRTDLKRVPFGQIWGEDLRQVRQRLLPTASTLRISWRCRASCHYGDAIHFETLIARPARRKATACITAS